MNRALLVGINNYPSPNKLNGCINDVTDMADFLVSNCNFSQADIRLLTDERATKDAIIERLGWLLGGIRAGDRILFHYSGHGAQMPLRNPQGDVDIVHDCICPVDFDWTEEHSICDTDFKRIFSAIPDDIEFIWISDSCFSGGLLKAMLKPKNKAKTIIPPADINWRLKTATGKKIKALGLKKSIENIDAALISGCTSEQESEDAVFDNRYNGALTYFLLQELKSADGMTETLTEIVNKISPVLTANYSQTPQLEGNDRILGNPFLAI